MSLSDPYIKEIPNALSEEFCEGLIKKFEEDDRKHPGLTFSGVTGMKVSMDLFISDIEDYAEEDGTLYRSLSEHTDGYVAGLPNGLGPEMLNVQDTGYNIQRTRVGEGYVWHDDSHVTSDGDSRIITFIWYLNDVHEGGETEFSCGVRVKPETGKLLLFPATWSYKHRGCRPISNDKYIVTGWFYTQKLITTHDTVLR